MLDVVLEKQIKLLSGKSNLRPLLKKFKKRITKAKENYKANASRLHEELDQDKDGKVSRTEFSDYILALQAHRKEGILGVLAAGDEGTLIYTRARFMAKKQKEGDIYQTSIQEERKGVKRATRLASASALANVVRAESSRGTRSGRSAKSLNGGSLHRCSDEKLRNPAIDAVDVVLNEEGAKLGAAVGQRGSKKEHKKVENGSPHRDAQEEPVHEGKQNEVTTKKETTTSQNTDNAGEKEADLIDSQNTSRAEKAGAKPTEAEKVDSVEKLETKAIESKKTDKPNKAEELDARNTLESQNTNGAEITEAKEPVKKGEEDEGLDKTAANEPEEPGKDD
eukprot:CAMPEP_0184492616 /NCGR_PEP_ID=MMETSP0113_2-20130426/23825_1 /TAXON_ID=91329 /ORGANISM="Norrisiella sphaerica, Strain BC52" /LENGTH=336 /DNA_ID=CAMNT_0026877517 /DNA_START=1 /DNA_END=1011 /DNA_ORIENTATION=-